MTTTPKRPRRKGPPPIIEETDYLILVTCPECGWRSDARTRGHGWILMAHHLKACHDDYQAFRNAENRANKLGYSFKGRYSTR